MPNPGGLWGVEEEWMKEGLQESPRRKNVTMGLMSGVWIQKRAFKIFSILKLVHMLPSVGGSTSCCHQLLKLEGQSDFDNIKHTLDAKIRLSRGKC